MGQLGIGVATGEQIPSPVIFKQMLASGALTHFQVDGTRLAGVNDVMAVILMAAHFDIPVYPHCGGIGFCNMIRHYAIWDQIAVSATSEERIVEDIDFQQADVFSTPVLVKEGCYVTPESSGWGLEMKQNFLSGTDFPTVRFGTIAKDQWVRPLRPKTFGLVGFPWWVRKNTEMQFASTVENKARKFKASLLPTFWQ